MAQERIDLVRNVRQQFEQAAVQVNMTTGALNDRAQNLQQLLHTLASLQQMLPGSERLFRIRDCGNQQHAQPGDYRRSRNGWR